MSRDFVLALEVPDDDHDSGVDDWIKLFANRNEVAEQYALLIRQHGPAWSYWSELNAAILRRWSPGGLRYIKTKAWRLIEQEQEP